MSKKTCPKCGSKFPCEGDKDCWCEKLQIHRVQMIEIMGLYTNCLCPECMKLYVAKE